MKKLFIYIIAFTLIGFNAVAQKKSAKEKRGDKYYFVYAYTKAIDAYTRTKHLTIEGQRKLAISYHKMGRNTESEIAYSKLVNMQGGNLPEDYYNYAMVLKNNGKYDEANKWMDTFSQLKPNDIRAKDYIANKDRLQDLLKDDNRYNIKHLDFNTDAEDFGAFYYKDKIVFTASRAKPALIQRKANWNGKPYLKMYVSDVQQGQMQSPEVFDKKLDGKFNNGPASFTKDGNYMAYTKNNEDIKRKDRVVNLEIYFSTYKDGKWSKPEPFYLNNKDYSVGHPCLTTDGNTMYYTSDMAGGYGGTDIYKITKNEKGQWGKPENLGDKINTEGNEMFPFFEEKNGLLFFSSDGRFGLGGLDIFICALKDSITGKVYNAGYPLNTQYDDFSLITDDKLHTGYFSSTNRIGGSGDDDIYTVDILKGLNIGKQIRGFAETTDGTHLTKTLVTLMTDSNTVLDTLTTKGDGAFTFFVDANKKFELSGKKPDYQEGDTAVNTFTNDYIVRADVILKKEEDTTEVKHEMVITNSDLSSILTKPIYFDFDKYNLRPDAVTELDKIVKVMNENPNMVVELRSYADCRGTKEYNQVLSDKRERATAQYIKAGITKPQRIYGKGYGESNPVNRCVCEGDVVSDCSEDEHQQNRRTEFTIIKNDLKINTSTNFK
jgi:outer membrane protein OmpA-like peptidoglycan-associated protein/tetratricopeptide (TPR) repeat protein